MMRTANPFRRWPFEGVANFRDIGGYPCPGGMTRYGVFFRSAHLHGATDHDLELMSQAGITSVVDLRYPDEYAGQADRVPSGVVVSNCSIMGSVTVGEIRVNSSVPDTRTMIRMYRQIFEAGKGEIARALRVLLGASGAAVYHCAAGKDRTGIITMFLLSIAGACREDIVADYEVSHTYIRWFTPDISGSHYSNMEGALDWLGRRYGGATEYLRSVGIAEDELRLLRDKLVYPLEL
jgi:protein-tyrosine phosphatase